MKRNTILKILNPILAILFIDQFLTGILHRSISRETFEVLHEGGGIVLVIVAALHLLLNLNWVTANFFKRNSKD